MIVLCGYDLEFKLCQFERVEVGPVVDVLDEAVDDACDGLLVVGGGVWVNGLCFWGLGGGVVSLVAEWFVCGLGLGGSGGGGNGGVSVVSRLFRGS